MEQKFEVTPYTDIPASVGNLSNTNNVELKKICLCNELKYTTNVGCLPNTDKAPELYLLFLILY